MTPPKPAFLLDTGPLSVLCSFPREGQPYLHTILRYATIVLPDAVITEAGRGRIYRTVAPLLQTEALQTVTTPGQPLILDTAYSRYLGDGERAVIKCALSQGTALVLDDQDAFIAACRFGLRPLVFQDFIIRLVKDQALPRETALAVVNATARQFPASFLTHTLDSLSQE